MLCQTEPLPFLWPMCACGLLPCHNILVMRFRAWQFTISTIYDIQCNCPLDYYNHASRLGYNYVTNMITGGWPALQGRDRGWRPASGVTCGNTEWVIAAINKMWRDQMLCIICYEMILCPSVSLLDIFPWSPDAHFLYCQGNIGIWPLL